MSSPLPLEDSPGFLPAGGKYRDLLSYKKAEIICDFTFRFFERFLNRGDRTIDQMVQAARSGKQNIAEGSKASVTSTETELKLTSVARASLEELLIDYQDYLSVRDLPQWPKRSMSASSADPTMSPMRSIGPIWNPARPKSSQTSPSV